MLLEQVVRGSVPRLVGAHLAEVHDLVEAELLGERPRVLFVPRWLRRWTARPVRVGLSVPVVDCWS